MAAEALAEAADREKRQRFAYRVIEGMEQRRKGAKRPEPIAERDDPHMLDAVVGKQALRIALKDDKARRDEDRQRAEHDQQAVGEIRSERVLRRRHEAHDAIQRGIQQKTG